MNINIEVYQLKQNVVMDEQNKASFYIYNFPFSARFDLALYQNIKFNTKLEQRALRYNY